MNLKYKIAVMQAFDRGEKVEFRYSRCCSENPWEPCMTPVWDWVNWEYRIAPKTRYLNVYVGNGVCTNWTTDLSVLYDIRCQGCIGYLEDKQDGSPYIFHQL